MAGSWSETGLGLQCVGMSGVGFEAGCLMAAKGPKREPGEPELHWRYRWVDTLPQADDEPDTLIPFRQMQYKNPERFYALYAEQQRRYDELKAKKKAEKEAVEGVVSGKAVVEIPLDECERLVGQMLDQWDKHRAK